MFRIPENRRRAFRQQLRRLVMVVEAAAALAVATPALAGSGPDIGHPAPPLAIHTLDGQDLSVGQYRGKVVILAFWAPWCAPCQRELPLLSAYAAAHAAEGLRVIGISVADPEQLSQVRNIASTLSFPVGLLGSAWAGDYGRIWRLPANFTVDRNGVLVDNSWNDDQSEWTAERLERIVSPLLQR